ncbi:hypothetical protein [Amycolatopsis sp. MJM2582]|uniref:hypothetical protein n=1 Tax=Amycolatopsis sp. MJM2582 TaxID=1427749 RepID=UPI000A815138|nr:hypothetical protein [Amycolatopsis sp. MJM2582]
MGYDLEWVDLPEPAAAARDRFEACLVRCVHVPHCASSYFELAAPFQFHLNVMGMAACREGMRRTAMTYEAEYRPFPAWPFADTEDWLSAAQDRRDEYDSAERAASAQTVAGMVGIPEFKLMSNGPWIVGDQEIGQALERYATAPAVLRSELEADELWRDWLAWLRETSGHGGFIVG